MENITDRYRKRMKQFCNRDLRKLNSELIKRETTPTDINMIISLLLNQKEKYIHEIEGLFQILDETRVRSPKDVLGVVKRFYNDNLEFKTPKMDEYWKIRVSTYLKFNDITFEELSMLDEVIKDYYTMWLRDLNDIKKGLELKEVRKSLRVLFKQGLSTEEVENMEYPKEVFQLIKYWKTDIENDYYIKMMKPCNDFLENGMKRTEKTKTKKK